MNGVQHFVKEFILPQEELEREGIWDFDRLSRPYIKAEFLQVSHYESTCNPEKHYLV